MIIRVRNVDTYLRKIAEICMAKYVRKNIKTKIFAKFEFLKIILWLNSFEQKKIV